MIIADFLAQLDKVKKQGAGWVARCPAHQDRSPSLSVTEGNDGRILLTCHAGCTTESVCDALGLQLADLFAEPLPTATKPKYEIERAYDYRDETGALLFQAVRQRLANPFDCPDAKRKKFIQRKPDGAGGWDYNLNGTRRVLYRLPELLQADAQATIFACEGEKDVDRLIGQGLIATTNPMGAGAAKNNYNWRDEYNAFLQGRDVVILPDNDQSGRDHAQAVAGSLQGVAASIRVLELPGLPDKGDVSNWLDAGGEVETLCAMVDDLPEWAPGPPPNNNASNPPPNNNANNSTANSTPGLAKTWADFDAEHFLQGERIAFAVERGEIALLNALPNAGKTTLALNAAVSLAAGLSLYPVVDRGKARRVLYIDGETRRARLQRDLRTMTKGFDRATAIAVGQNLHVICEAEIGGESLALTRINHLLELSAEAIRIKPDFIVVDTLSSLCPVFNENDNAEQQRKVWRPLQKLARDCDAAILVLHHVGKRSEDAQTPERVYRGRGASASGGAARAVWLMIPDQSTKEISTLSCPKAKGEAPQDVRLKLDPATRWLSVQVIEPQPTVTALERVLEVVSREMKASEIKAALQPFLKDRAVEEALAEALQLQKLRLVKRGVYAPLQTNSAPTAETANDLDAEGAVSAERDEEDPELSFRTNRTPPIVSAVSAETITSSAGNGLDPKQPNSQKTPVRKLAEEENANSKFPHSPHPPMTSAVSAETPAPANTLRPLDQVLAELNDPTHHRRVTL